MTIVKRHEITDSQWSRILPFIPAPKGRHGGDIRLFLNAVLWIAKTGSPWRDLPDKFGNWSIIYQRFSAWSDKNNFFSIFQALQEPDLEEVMIDSTVVKLHQSATGGQKKMVLKLLADLLGDLPPKYTRFQIA